MRLASLCEVVDSLSLSLLSPLSSSLSLSHSLSHSLSLSLSLSLYLSTTGSDNGTFIDYGTQDWPLEDLGAQFTRFTKDLGLNLLALLRPFLRAAKGFRCSIYLLY